MKLKNKIDFLVNKIKSSIRNNKSYLSLLQMYHIDLYMKNGFTYDQSPFIKKWYDNNIYTVFNKKYHKIDKIDKKKIEQKIKKIISIFKKKDSYLSIFIDGKYNRKLSNKDNYIDIKNISSYKYNNIIKDFYGKLHNNHYDVFYSLNTIFSIMKGVFIDVNNISIKKNIEIIHISTGIYPIIYPRILILVRNNNNIQINENYKCLDENNVIINSVNEIYSLDYSKIIYNKLQNNLNKLYIIDNTFIKQENKSICKVYTFSFYCKKIKNNLNFFSIGKKTSSYLYGISILSDSDSINNSTFMKHSSSNSNSYQLYKNILFDNSNSIFDGKITVEKNIKNINAFQKNNNIILSKKSNVYTKPQLKIYSKDVRCTHGCTIGNIHKSELFYLKSRGIPEKESKILLLLSFLDDIIKYIDSLKLKKYIQKELSNYLDNFL
ncbi:SufB/SufD family protein [Blattabacterium cuenoti]|uniref:SufB/SufD family protein n=1 Tax=Blattabacterium cuenoti TaxID=1653831 RepID=UPI00163BC490|nr:SufD family Fe-S cluster assembly protein [Blattabacterium cuenoti]